MLHQALVAIGPPGTAVNWRGAWSGASVYAQNDGVSYNGSGYVALLASTNVAPDSDATKWQIIASKGDVGPTGPSYTPPAKTYAAMPSQATLQADLTADASGNVKRAYHLPAGSLSITSDLTLAQGQIIQGQSRSGDGFGTVLSLGASGRIVMAQQSGLERVRISHSASATKDAIYATEISSGSSVHQITLRDVDYTGGSAGNGTWAIHLQNPAEWHFERLKLLPTGNGIRLECTNDYAFNPGDGYAYNVQIRLQAGGTTGLHIAGQQAIASGGVYCNRIPNDQHWFGFYLTAADIGAGWTTAGNIGIRIDNTAKVYFYGANLEELQTDCMLTGQVGSNINAYTVAGGSGYTVGDTLTFSNAHSGTQAQATVATVSSGAVLTLTWITRGTGYQAGDVLTSTGGTGTGAGLTVSSIGGPATNAVRFFGSWFADAWTVNSGVTDAHFDGKFDVEPTGTNIANISINGVRTGQANSASVAQIATPHYRGAVGTKTILQEIYALNNSGADILNNRVCAWDSSGNLILMTSTHGAGVFAGTTFGTITNGTSGFVVAHGNASIGSTGVVAVGDYVGIDASNPGKVLSFGTTPSSTQPTIGTAVSGGTNATIVVRLNVRPPVASAAAFNGPWLLKSGLYYSSGLTWTTATPGVNQLVAAPLYIANSVTLDQLAIEVTAGIASGLCRLGIYNDSGAGVPGTLLVDAGTVSGVSIAFVTATISQTPAPGLYWLAYVAQTAAATVRVVNTPSLMTGYATSSSAAHMGYLSGTSTSGALPASFGTPSDTGGVPRVMVHVA